MRWRSLPKGAEEVTTPRSPKYRNKITVEDGIKFHSKKEASRYRDLKILQGAGEISGLRLQPAYVLNVNGSKICKYVADFEYTEGGALVAEDVKGVKTPVYKLKAKLFRSLYPSIVLRET